jgi:hypothetical protein
MTAIIPATRRRLPQRRGAIAAEFEHAGHRFRMQVGCFPDGALGEVFVDATKPNSALDALAADAAILLSLLLQHGATPVEIGHMRLPSKLSSTKRPGASAHRRCRSTGVEEKCYGKDCT